jgi:hypothetical protein
MLDCDRTKELIWAYCEGSLDGETASLVERHLAGCAGCAREFRAAGATLRGLGSLERLEPAPDFLGAVWRRIDEREAAGRLRGLRPLWKWLSANRVAVAAGSLAFFLALVGVRYGLGDRGAPGTTPMDVAGEREAGGAASMKADNAYRDDYILRDIPEATPVVSSVEAGPQDTIETRFITRELVPPVPSSNTYVQPVVQPVSEDDTAF